MDLYFPTFCKCQGLLVSFAGPYCAPGRRAGWCSIQQEVGLSLLLLLPPRWAQAQLDTSAWVGQADPPSHTAQLQSAELRGMLELPTGLAALLSAPLAQVLLWLFADRSEATFLSQTRALCGQHFPSVPGAVTPRCCCGSGYWDP